MRDVFQSTFTFLDASGNLKPAAGVEITVLPVGGIFGTTTASTIYQRREGAGQGNAPEAAVAGGPNPFTTGTSGSVEFWAPAGVYDIHVKDTIVPARVQQRGAGGTAAPITWNSAPMAAGSIPSNALAADGGVLFAALAADAQRQSIPIGGIMNWWRPDATVAVPTGFEECKGQTILAANHQFPGVTGNIILPDLRNKFVLGADSAFTQGLTPTANDLVTGAPGIGAIGGTNAAHFHSISAHYHGKGNLGISDPGHSHGGATASMNRSNPHNHGILTQTSRSTNANNNPGINLSTDFQDYSGGTQATDINHEHAINAGATGVTISGTYVGNNGGANGDAAFNSATSESRPWFIGLAAIMKVRRS